MKDPVPEGQDALLNEVWTFSLFEALFGRRARRFAYGMEIPHGPLAFKSNHAPLPLSELEQALLIAAGTGVTGWHVGRARGVGGRGAPLGRCFAACCVVGLHRGEAAG